MENNINVIPAFGQNNLSIDEHSELVASRLPLLKRYLDVQSLIYSTKQFESYGVDGLKILKTATDKSSEQAAEEFLRKLCASQEKTWYGVFRQTLRETKQDLVLEILDNENSSVIDGHEQWSEKLGVFREHCLSRLETKRFSQILLEKGLLRDYHVQQITAEFSRAGRSSAAFVMLSIIQRRKNWYPTFLRALYDEGQRELVKLIDEDKFEKLEAQALYLHSMPEVDRNCDERRADTLDDYQEAYRSQDCLDAPDNVWRQNLQSTVTTVPVKESEQNLTKLENLNDLVDPKPLAYLEEKKENTVSTERPNSNITGNIQAPYVCHCSKELKTQRDLKLHMKAFGCGEFSSEHDSHTAGTARAKGGIKVVPAVPSDRDRQKPVEIKRTRPARVRFQEVPSDRGKVKDEVVAPRQSSRKENTSQSAADARTRRWVAPGPPKSSSIENTPPTGAKSMPPEERRGSGSRPAQRSDSHKEHVNESLHVNKSNSHQIRPSPRAHSSLSSCPPNHAAPVASSPRGCRRKEWSPPLPGALDLSRYICVCGKLIRSFEDYESHGKCRKGNGVPPKSPGTTKSSASQSESFKCVCGRAFATVRDLHVHMTKKKCSRPS
ncbi:uncharacterized protein LOC101846979 [Aplysia californica]|uniref:Uncharacterized protein LOC101846979 n=1 Tax=Aplysia californica TaxID=6500 RepID=A0ABM0K012_APLCA|nr:uncharacterized protein LOC101846979 [Aplysia californica]